MRMSEVHANLEQAQQFIAPLPLHEFRERVGRNLDLIEAGAEMIARHVRSMDRRPSFDARARIELEMTEAVLERALIKVRASMSAFDQKPQERS